MWNSEILLKLVSNCKQRLAEVLLQQYVIIFNIQPGRLLCLQKVSAGSHHRVWTASRSWARRGHHRVAVGSNVRRLPSYTQSQCRTGSRRRTHNI